MRDARMRCATLGCDARCYIASYHRASHPSIAHRVTGNQRRYDGPSRPSYLSAVLLDEWVFFCNFCQCCVTVTMFRNNVSVICYMLVTGYVLLGLLRNIM